MKQTETRKVMIDNIDFYIIPFSAFKCANLSGELAGVLVPILSGLIPIAQKFTKENMDLMDIELGNATSEVAGAFSVISGDKIEILLKKLLLQNNIVVKIEMEKAGEEQVHLDEDLANELFCGEVQNMFLLAFEVIRSNFNGFFKKATNLSGKVGEMAKKTKRKIL